MTAYMELKQIVEHHDREATASAHDEPLAVFHRRAAIAIRHVMALMPMDGNLPRQQHADQQAGPQATA